MPTEPRPVPVKTIAASIGLVLATVVGLYLVVLLARIELWLIVAAFFAVVMNKPVEFVRHYLHLSRGLSVMVVYVLGIVIVSGLMYLFIRPLVTEVQDFADNFSSYVADARAGEGRIGDLVKRYELDKKFDENREDIDAWLSSAGGGAVDVAQSVANGLIALVTILVLSILMILYGPDLLRSGVGILSPPTRQRVTAVARDCSSAITGYVMGNLLISIIAGLVTYVGLWVFGVPFKEVLALWVGFADLIPLVGATLGAIPAVGVAFLHSTTAGIGVLILYIVYQQFENHVLQVTIMAKTVKINQLFVLVSVLIGVELLGFVGALLAIPAAGVIQVIVRDSWDNHRRRLKPEPTIGAEEMPLTEFLAEEAAAAAEEAAASDGSDTAEPRAPSIAERQEELEQVAAPPPSPPSPPSPPPET